MKTMVSFFLEWVTSHTKNATKQKFEYPFSWVTKRDPKTPSDLTLLCGMPPIDVASGDIPVMSTSSIMPFHNVDSNLVH